MQNARWKGPQRKRCHFEQQKKSGDANWPSIVRCALVWRPAPPLIFEQQYRHFQTPQEESPLEPRFSTCRFYPMIGLPTPRDSPPTLAVVRDSRRAARECGDDKRLLDALAIAVLQQWAIRMRCAGTR